MRSAILTMLATVVLSAGCTEGRRLPPSPPFSEPAVDDDCEWEGERDAQAVAKSVHGWAPAETRCLGLLWAAECSAKAVVQRRGLRGDEADNAFAYYSENALQECGAGLTGRVESRAQQPRPE